VAFETLTVVRSRQLNGNPFGIVFALQTAPSFCPFSCLPVLIRINGDTTMKIDEIKLLYDYNDWVDARTLAACARVSPEQDAAPTSYGHGGLRATMVHILDNIWQQ
jgi:hypothetical protein